MAAIILAGGLSSRMGADKSRLAIDGTGILQLLVKRFGEAMGRVIVVVRPDQQPPLSVPSRDRTVSAPTEETGIERLTIAQDIYPGVGPLGGLHAGLAASPDDENFVLACDMPFAEPRLAVFILSRLAGRDAAVPMPARGPEPLYAAYRKSCLPTIQSSIEAGRLRVREALRDLNVVYVPEEEMRPLDPDLRSFRNINTPEDYREALRIMRSS